MSPETLHIVVDVHVDGDQILGQADDGVTGPKPFSGWLGLIGALDGLVRGAVEAGDRAPAPAPPGGSPRPAISPTPTATFSTTNPKEQR